MRLVKKALLSTLALVCVLALVVVGVRLVNHWRFPEQSGADPRDLASYDLEQEGMEVEQVTGERLTGFHLVPDEVTRDGVVVTFGGSEGGPAYDRALCLARQGHEVYALFFFGQENQPEALEQVPLEFFGEVTERIEQGAVRPGPLSVIGASKGAELALLLAEHYPEIDNVVLFAPAMYSFQGLGGAWPGSSSWSLEGEQLPYLSFENSSVVGGLTSQLSAWVFDHPTEYRSTYESVVENSPAAERDEARLDPTAVEGGLLVFAGGQDEMWQSEVAAEEIGRANPGADIYVFDEAGHVFAGPGHAMGLATGGTVEANEEAGGRSTEILHETLAGWHG